MEIADIFKSLGDETRIRMLNLLNQGELCVCDIEEVLGIQQSNASRHLNKLKQVGLIQSEKKSQWVYYRFNQDTFSRYPFLNNLVAEVGNDPICARDVSVLSEHKARASAC